MQNFERNRAQDEVASALLSLRFTERDFFIDNLLVQIHFTIVMIWWTGFATWEFEIPFSGSSHLPSAFDLQLSLMQQLTRFGLLKSGASCLELWEWELFIVQGFGFMGAGPQ
jgi:hypothetical protein